MATLTKTKADQIFEAAKAAYDSCKALKNTFDQSIRSQGVEPKVLRKKTESVYLDPTKLSDQDMFIGGILLKDAAKKVNAKTPTAKAGNGAKLPNKLRAKI